MPVLHIGTEAYQTMIREADKPVLMEFQTPWCSYCRRLAPALERLAQAYRDRLIVGQVNTDEEPELAETEQIEVVPTLLLYADGRLLDSIVVPEPGAQLEAFIGENLRRREDPAGEGACTTGSR